MLVAPTRPARSSKTGPQSRSGIAATVCTRRNSPTSTVLRDSAGVFVAVDRRRNRRHLPAPEGMFATPRASAGKARFGASRMIGNVRPRPPARAAAAAAMCGFVLTCASARMAIVRAGRTMQTPDKQLSAEQSRADRRDHPRGNRAPPHLPAGAGRTGQAQPVDAGKGAGRPPAVHAGDHGAAGAGARRVPAQGARRRRRRPAGQRRCRARRPRLLFAARGALARRDAT